MTELQKIDAFVEANRENILRDIARLVAVPSVQEAPLPGMPFGEGPAKALDKALEIARDLGLTAVNCENYIGYAEIPGESADKYLATITHCDVVPVGNGWDTDPYKMEIRDGWMLGRGVCDDKGPGILCLYALKYLQDSGAKLRYPVRALLGANEETGMLDVDYYCKNYPAPAFCFTPDASFPVCNGEKGHFSGCIVGPKAGEGDLLAFEGGVANNAVADRATALIRGVRTLEGVPGRITVETEGENTRLRAYGIAGHAAMPEGTLNAISLLVNYMMDNGIGSEAERRYFAALQKLHAATDGSGLGLACADEVFHALTIIGGVMMTTRDGRFCQTWDCRYPTAATGAALKEKVVAAVGDLAEVCHVHYNDPFYISADHPAIRACIDTFNQVTGQNAQPFTMGGGTYARHFPCAVSFGPEVDDLELPAFAGHIHGANEAAPIEIFMQALKIYILTLLKLEQLDF